MHGNHTCHSCGDPLTLSNLLKVLTLGVAQQVQQMVQLHSVHGSFLAHGLGALYLGLRASWGDLRLCAWDTGVYLLVGFKVLITITKLGFRNFYLRHTHEQVGQTGPMTVVSDVLGILWSTVVIIQQRSRRNQSSWSMSLFQGTLLVVPLLRLCHSWAYMRDQWRPPGNRGQLLSFIVLVVQEAYRVVPLACSSLGLISGPVVPVVVVMELVQQLAQTLVVTVHCVGEPRTESWLMVLVNGLILGVTHMTRAQILISHSDNGYLVCADRSWYSAIKTAIYLGHRTLCRVVNHIEIYR